MKNKKHLILDIETLGTEPGTQILSIAAVCGNAALYLTNIYTPKFMDAKIDYDTVKWWLTQPSKKAQAELFNREGGLALCDALNELTRFIERQKPDYFWGCSPDFDYGHIKYWLDRAGKLVPWQFWQLRDIRTIRDYVDPKIVEEIKARYTPHIAIDDAQCEQEILNAFLEKYSY